LGSLQVVRRMHNLLKDLEQIAPPFRRAAVLEQRRLLRAAAEAKSAERGPSREDRLETERARHATEQDSEPDSQRHRVGGSGLLRAPR
jgi:hypothetical protein